MAFKFRLQAVLDMAQRIQDQKVQLLADAQAQHRAELDHLEFLIRDQEKKREELLEAQRMGVIDLQSIQWGLDYLGVLANQEAERRGRVAKALEAVEAARTELMAAAQKVQVLEKLKANHKAAYTLKLDKAEAALIDELSTQRFARNSESSPSSGNKNPAALPKGQDGIAQT